MKPHHRRTRSKAWIGATAALAASALVYGAIAEASSSSSSAPTAAGTSVTPVRLGSTLQGQFAAAAREFHVPTRVLLALSYQQSLWDTHEGLPSTTGNYNVMGLTQVSAADLAPTAAGEVESGGSDDPAIVRHAAAAKSKAKKQAPAVDASAPGFHTLDAAAKLIGEPASALKSDARQNIRGGAALLASYEKKLNGSLPADPGQWYRAVAQFAHADDAATAKEFADRVYTVMRTGARRTTAEQQAVSLSADPGLKVTGAASASTLAGAGVAPRALTVTRAAAGPSFSAECPTGLSCTVAPALYKQDSADITDYGNYALADRSAAGGDITSIVIHDAEGTVAGAIAHFQDPTSYASSHYIVGMDGSVAQMVPTADMSWDAANKTFNTHSVGVEHEGYAAKSGQWYTPSEYQSSAKLVRYLATRFSIPLDRQHIIGHDEVPGINDSMLPAQHWDPGPYWDWSYYFSLLGAPLSGNDQAVVGGTVTIAPPYTTANQPAMVGCDGTGTGTAACPAHPANFVYLYKGPGTGSGLIQDADYAANNRTGSTGKTWAADWTDKAVYGETFVVAQISGDWTAIWYGGQKAWFYNPGGANAYANNKPGAQLATPAAGSAVPVYGRAFPDSSAFGTNTALAANAPMVPLSYSFSPGQSYFVAGALTTGDYYDSNNYYPDYTSCVNGGGCQYYKSSVQYYPISFNHRLVFVKSSDVKLSAPVTPATSTYVPVTPTRLLDTRYGIGAAKAKVGPGASIALKIAGATAGASTVPKSGVTAVVLNVTETGATQSGFVSVYPDGTPLPNASNLNFTTGQTVPNLVTVPLGADGSVRLYNRAGSVHLIADISGYYVSGPSGAHFVGSGPTRVMDSRTGKGVRTGPVGQGGSVALQLSGAGGVISDPGVTAVVLNVTVTSPTAASDLIVYPSGPSRPTVSNLNYTAKQTISNLVVVPVGADGKVMFYNQSGTVQVIADLAGYFTTGGGSVFHTVAPARVMDTRYGTGVRAGVVGAGGTVSLPLGATHGIPLNATAVVMNVTVAGPTAGGFVTVYPDGRTMPGVSNINFAAGQTLPNLVVVPVVNGRVDFTNKFGSVSLIADLTGFFTAG